MIKRIFLIFFVIAIGFAVYFSFPNLFHKNNIALENYQKTLDTIQTIRKNLKNKSTEEKGKAFTNLMVDKIFPYWYGTPWNFNGTTQKPNEGKIACGYFVTTTIEDMGFPINRIKLAQCASEEMIKNLVSKENITRFSGISMEDFEKKIIKKGNGLYIIGLDNHTGFVLVSDKGNYFIHSNGYFPQEVMKEKLSDSKIIAKSKYRVVGKISADKKFLNNWTK
ncbi:hypothetical protein ACFPVY_00120 [Flavobacterium qiangtangense]|uniref:Uncharacterized protein n=1 Tax=Flavobacterium qiangtangense TaxID=1442595 RepID=A0ABW1PHD1_9FLAO